MHDATSTTTRHLKDALRRGNHDALEALFPFIYQTLHDLAHRQRMRWQGDLTLNTTALVHEAYLRLFGQERSGWESRVHFLSVASRAMRHILLDYARRRQALKRGGTVKKVSLHHTGVEDLLMLAPERVDEVVALGTALEELARVSAREARVVECRFFGGMTIAETAAALNVSAMTVKRDWALARAWLYRELGRLGVSLPA